MAKVLERRACPKCTEAGRDTSGDNLHVFETGHQHCFACSYHVYPENPVMQETPHGWTEQYVPWRGISAETMVAYKAHTLVAGNGVPEEIHFRYPRGTKIRPIASKTFRAVGDLSSGQLFGQDLFPAGSAKAITITEGELDALSVFQMFGNKYPVVSVRSSSAAKRDCADQFDYLNSFDTIYLCFDNDPVGQGAVKSVASLFDFNKVFHVKLTGFKDANEFLMAGREEEFRKIWWNSKRFLPDEIISSYSEIDEIIDNDKIEAGISYPWPRLQEMTYGMRAGEFILLSALEGIGKTEFIRAIEYHVLKETPEDFNIGIIHLEESKGRAVKGLIGYELKSPVHLPDSVASKEELKAAYRRLTKGDNRVHYYSHSSCSSFFALLYDAFGFCTVQGLVRSFAQGALRLCGGYWGLRLRST